MSHRPSPEPITRARSLHDKRPFNVAVFFALIHYLCLIAFLTCVVIVILNPKPESIPPMIAAAIASALTWLVSFFRRRSARCPLCKGTPLLGGGAVKHAKAYRLRPLNHATTSVLGILFLHRFRCMYCGTPYDVLKPSSNQRFNR